MSAGRAVVFPSLHCSLHFPSLIRTLSRKLGLRSSVEAGKPCEQLQSQPQPLLLPCKPRSGVSTWLLEWGSPSPTSLGLANSSFALYRPCALALVRWHLYNFKPTYGLTDQLAPTAGAQQGCTVLHGFPGCVPHPRWSRQRGRDVWYSFLQLSCSTCGSNGSPCRQNGLSTYLNSQIFISFIYLNLHILTLKYLYRLLFHERACMS